MDGGLRGGAALSLACCPPRCRGGPERQRTAARSGRGRRRVPRRPSTRTSRRSARPARRGRRRSGRAWTARRPPRAPLRRYPTPSCATCPAPAKVALHRAPPGTPYTRQGRGYAWRSPSMRRGHDRASPPRYAPAFHREPSAMSHDTTALVSYQRQPQLDEHYCSSDKPGYIV